MDKSAERILDGEILYSIEFKIREHGKKLDGEHTRFMHLNPENIVEKPHGFLYKWYDVKQVQELYETTQFYNALNYDTKGEIMALAALKDDIIVSLVTVDDICYKGLWQIGIDTDSIKILSVSI